LQPFKPGLGLLAVETGVPVVPALIEGTYEAMPKGRLLPRKSKIRVTFAEPVKVEMFTAAKQFELDSAPTERRQLYQQLTDEVRQRIERLQG
jgi:1-acyl-sn-glycerol-3-phosphate acyltransferase